MADINLDAGNDTVTLEFDFQTPQVFFYTITVVDDQGKQFFHDTGAWNGKTNFTLGNAGQLSGLYLCIDWTILDPTGANNTYVAIAYANQVGTRKVYGQVCSGKSKSTYSNVSTTGKFV